MTGTRTVKGHELVGLSAAEVATPHEYIETFPLIAVSRRKGIKIHARSLSR